MGTSQAWLLTEGLHLSLSPAACFHVAGEHSLPTRCSPGVPGRGKRVGGRQPRVDLFKVKLRHLYLDIDPFVGNFRLQESIGCFGSFWLEKKRM